MNSGVISEELMIYSLNCAKESGLTKNSYFTHNFLKRHYFISNLKNIIFAIQQVKNKNDALYFGPGFGILLPALSKLFNRVVGMDIDENQLNGAKKLIADHKISNVNLLCKHPDAEFDDFDGESFDCIVADNVLEHIASHYEIILNFYRLLRVDGLLIVSLPSENLIYRLFESKNDGHVLRRSKDIHFLLSNIREYFTEIGNLDVKPFFITRVFSKLNKVSENAIE